ncbi:MAG: alpha/beta hydrolase [Rhodocyclaceae bacterium]|nr:alpha/beta hydrolase [Rhodocyclaceae bacterium]
MNYVDVFFESNDGLRLYARDYSGPKPDSPVLLCLAGLTRSSKDFDGLATALCASYRVICPDQRGRGRSAKDQQPTRYRPDIYVSDMVRLLDVLAVPGVSVIGTSLGGMMGILLTVSQPGRVKTLIINDMGPVINPVGIARITSYVGKSAPVKTWADAIAQTKSTNGVAFPNYTDAQWAAMARNLYVQEGTTPVLDYDPAIAQGFGAGTATPDLWPLFDAMPPLPLMVIRGELTDILSLETLAEMQRRRPQMQVAHVAGVGHAPMLDEPAARAAIVNFLARAATS